MAPVDLFDRVLKILARQHTEVFLRLAFPDIPLQLIGTMENVELVLPEERVDFLHQVVYNDEELYVHLEFQWQHRRDVPERLFTYSAALTKQFKRPVMTAVIYLARREAPIPDEYVVRVGEIVVNRFKYPVVKLWEYEEAIRKGEFRELAPLLVALVKKPDEVVLKQEKELILVEEDVRKRANLLATAVMVASRYFEKGFLWKFFREEVEQMRKASFIEEWIEEEVQRRIQRRIQQGVQQGLLQGHREAVLSLLLAKFEMPYDVGKDVEEKLEAIEDKEVLKALIIEAARAEALKAFKARLKEAIANVKTGKNES
jgi:hypothetical protein